MIEPDREVLTTCPYCGVGCNLNLLLKNDMIYKVTSPFDSVVNQGNLCVKGRFGYDFIYHPKRITVPLVRKTPQKSGQRTQAFILTNGLKSPGIKPSTWSQIVWWKSTSEMDRMPWPVTCVPKQPMRTIICSKSCFGLSSGPIMSTTARDCAMPDRL